MKKEGIYFPHFAGSRNDRKIKRLRKDLKSDGYACFFMIIEVLREQADFSYPVLDIDLLSDDFGISEAIVKATISNYGLFNFVERENEQMFFSPKFNEFMQPFLSAKERRKIGGIKGNLIKYGKVTKEQAQNMTDEQILNFDSKNEVLTISKPSVSESVTDNLPISKPSDFLAKEKKEKEKKRKEKKEKEIKEKEEAYANYSFLFINESFKETYSFFLEMRKEKKQIPTLRAEGMILKKLAEFSENGKNIEIAIESLENSIIAKYPNVYKPKVDFQKKNYSENPTGVQKSNFEKNNEVYQNTQKVLDSEEYQKASAARKVWVDPLA